MENSGFLQELRQFVDCEGDIRACNAQVLESTNSTLIQSWVIKGGTLKGRETCGCGHGRGNWFGSSHVSVSKYVQNVSFFR
jgi:hypothetical protein